MQALFLFHIKECKQFDHRKEKNTMKKSNEEKTYATLKPGKTYKFAGYNWMACEVDDDRHVAVIQSRGVTYGPWPGFKMAKFGGEINTSFATDIDGEDISTYDDKMQKLYNAIKYAEDKSATYGEGLYLVSKEKVGYIESDNIGSGNYWQALQEAANNFSSIGASCDIAWLGTADEHSSTKPVGSDGGDFAWYVNRDGNIYEYFQDYQEFVIAPAFNLDLSKVKVVDNKIVIIDNKFGISLIEKPDVYGLVKSEIIKMYDMLDTDEVYPLEISGSQSSAMGFITQKAAEVIDYDYENSGLNEFISSILDDMDKESEDSIYDFHGIKIHLER